MLRHAISVVAIVLVFVVGNERKGLGGATGLPTLRHVSRVAALQLHVSFLRAGHALSRNGLAASRIHYFEHNARFIVLIDPERGSVIL